MANDNEERKAQWQPHVEAWQASGLSARRFCSERSLPYSRFLYWAGKFRSPATTMPTSHFTRVVPVGRISDAAGLQITLPSGLRISGIDEDTVALLPQLLAQL